MNSDHLAELVADHQARQVQRRRERAELLAVRQHGLRARHRNKLAHLKESTMATPLPANPSTTGDRSLSGSRDNAHQCGEAPPRRSGRRCGYPGRSELDLTLTHFRAALSELARDPDPEARRVGARLAAEATETLDRLRQTAEQASTRWRRTQEAATKLGETLDRRLAEITNHTTPKGPST